jgi:hypothetical protein
MASMIAQILLKSNGPEERRRPQFILPPSMEIGQLAIKLELEEKWMDRSYLATKGTYRGIRENCRYCINMGTFRWLDKSPVKVDTQLA